MGATGRQGPCSWGGGIWDVKPEERRGRCTEYLVYKEKDCGGISMGGIEKKGNFRPKCAASKCRSGVFLVMISPALDSPTPRLHDSGR